MKIKYFGKYHYCSGKTREICAQVEELSSRVDVFERTGELEKLLGKLSFEHQQIFCAGVACGRTCALTVLVKLCKIKK